MADSLKALHTPPNNAPLQSLYILVVPATPVFGIKSCSQSRIKRDHRFDKIKKLFLQTIH